MSKKKNPNGSRVERENKFADALGLGTGRTFMGACLSAFESGAEIEISFVDPKGQRKTYRALPAPIPSGFFTKSANAKRLEAQLTPAPLAPDAGGQGFRSVTQAGSRGEWIETTAGHKP